MKTTVSSKGQIVLPAEIRKQDGIEAGQEFEVDTSPRLQLCAELKGYRHLYPDEAETVDAQYVEPDVYEPTSPSGADEMAPRPAPTVGDEDAPKPLWRRLASLAFPIALVLYLVISAIANR